MHLARESLDDQGPFTLSRVLEDPACCKYLQHFCEQSDQFAQTLQALLEIQFFRAEKLDDCDSKSYAKAANCLDDELHQEACARSRREEASSVDVLKPVESKQSSPHLTI